MSPSVFVASALAQYRCPGQKLTQWIVIVRWICVADFFRGGFLRIAGGFLRMVDFRGGLIVRRISPSSLLYHAADFRGGFLADFFGSKNM